METVTDSLQDLRYKLQKRYARLLAADPETFAIELVRFWDYFDSVPAFIATAAELAANHPSVKSDIDSSQRGAQIHRSTESESAAIGYEIVRRAATVDEHRLPFLDYVHGASWDDALEQFRSGYLDPFYEYIDEHLQDRNLVLAYLVRFKHLAEWFRRNELWAEYSSATGVGERSLAFRLYEYLYEQGIEFSIEPTSASGEADMIGLQGGKDPLLADVKIFDPSGGRGKTYIQKGFHQVYRYLQDFNKAVGYLVVFKITDKNLHVEGAVGNIPRIMISNKTIFLVEIDIYPHQASASKRPIAETEVVTVADLAAIERESEPS